LPEVDGFEIVLDGAGRKHRRIISLADMPRSGFDIFQDDVL
jgi:hypothetical protein